LKTKIRHHDAMPCMVRARGHCFGGGQSGLWPHRCGRKWFYARIDAASKLDSLGDVSQMGAYLVSGDGAAWVSFQRIEGRTYSRMQPSFLDFLPHDSLLQPVEDHNYDYGCSGCFNMMRRASRIGLHL